MSNEELGSAGSAVSARSARSARSAEKAQRKPASAHKNIEELKLEIELLKEAAGEKPHDCFNLRIKRLSSAVSSRLNRTKLLRKLDFLKVLFSKYGLDVEDFFDKYCDLPNEQISNILSAHIKGENTARSKQGESLVIESNANIDSNQPSINNGSSCASSSSCASQVFPVGNFRTSTLNQGHSLGAIDFFASGLGSRSSASAASVPSYGGSSSSDDSSGSAVGVNPGFFAPNVDAPTRGLTDDKLDAYSYHCLL